MEKVIFIDRDGVINRDPGGWTRYSYVTEWSEFVFIPGSPEAIKRLNDHGYEVVVISNQGGVSKGYYTKNKLDEINIKMLDELRKRGASVKRTYYCIHQDSDMCDCRKPGTGLFRQAEKELGVDVKDKYFIGDGKMDIEAGNKLGMKTVFVLSGKSNLEMLRDWDIKPDYIFDDLKEAVDFIIRRERQ